MRRLFMFVLALGMVVASPATSALAQERVQFIVRVAETSAGVNPDGTSYAAGSYRVIVDGAVIEVGTTQSFYQLNEDASFVYGTRTYTDSATGNTVTVDQAARLTRISADGTRFFYRGGELIVASNPPGLSGRASVSSIVTPAADGSYGLTATGMWTIEFPE